MHMRSLCVVAVVAVVSATASESVAAPSASELLGLLEEWNLGMFRDAFQQKNIDGFALMGATKADLDEEFSNFGAIHRRALYNRAQSLQQVTRRRQLAAVDWKAFLGVNVRNEKPFITLGPKDEVKIAFVNGGLTIHAPSVDYKTESFKINGGALVGKDGLFERVDKLGKAGPACDGSKSTAVALWTGRVDGYSTRALPKGFTDMAKTALPKASSYLILSSFRIKHAGAASAFVAANVAYPGGTSLTRMIIENYDSTAGFNNIGGSVSWVVKSTGSGTLSLRYKTTDGKGETWFNDGNGIPELLSVDLGTMWHREQTSVSGTRLLPKGMTTVQTIPVPSAGTYLVISNYRLKVVDHKTQSFVSCAVNYEGKNTKQRMITENVFTPGKFINMGGQVSWLVTTSKATSLNIQYRSTSGKDYWFNDGNGVPAATAIRVSDLHGWHKEVDGPGFSMAASWKDNQKVTLPAPGKYLVLANYRIWLGSKNSGFVKARVVLGSAEVGKVKMITERMHPTRTSFINYGGMVGWVVTATKADSLSVQYFSTIGGHYRMVNDGNGVPQMQVIRLSGCGGKKYL